MTRDQQVKLRDAVNEERRGIASQLRDIESRIGIAASPLWVREELRRVANQLEVWAESEGRLVEATQGEVLSQ